MSSPYCHFHGIRHLRIAIWIGNGVQSNQSHSLKEMILSLVFSRLKVIRVSFVLRYVTGVRLMGAPRRGWKIGGRWAWFFVFFSAAAKAAGSLGVSFELLEGDERRIQAEEDELYANQSESYQGTGRGGDVKVEAGKQTDKEGEGKVDHRPDNDRLFCGESDANGRADSGGEGKGHREVGICLLGLGMIAFVVLDHVAPWRDANDRECHDQEERGEDVEKGEPGSGDVLGRG